jgi:hypothetical protein
VLISEIISFIERRRFQPSRAKTQPRKNNKPNKPADNTKKKSEKPDVKTPIKLLDGHIWLSGHFRDRWEERFTPEDWQLFIDVLRKAIRVFGSQWESQGASSFVIHKPNKFSFAVRKVQERDGAYKYKYILTTLHEDLIVYADQHVYTVY